MSAALELLPEWLRWLVLLAGLALGAIVVIAASLAALGLAVMAAEASWRGAKRLTLWLADMLVKLALLLVVDLIGAGCRAAARALWAVCKARAARFQRRLELRRVWKAEFREDFETFADFLRAFENNGKPAPKARPRPEERREPHFDPPPVPPKRERPQPPPPPPPPDPRVLAFRAACTLLGLPEAGFTLAQLKERHRVLIQRLHPDMGGSHQRAAAINAARDLIKHTKGWTTS